MRQPRVITGALAAGTWAIRRPASRIRPVAIACQAPEGEVQISHEGMDPGVDLSRGHGGTRYLGARERASRRARSIRPTRRAAPSRRDAGCAAADTGRYGRSRRYLGVHEAL